jgi:Mismatch repair ATPase (MutS family)
MFKNKDFLPETDASCWGKEFLSSDLGTDRIVDAMARGDKHIKASCAAALYAPLDTREAVIYRQHILRDVFACPDMMRSLFMLSCDALDEARKSWYWLDSRFLSSTFSSAVGLLRMYVKKLLLIRAVADRLKQEVTSEELLTFFNGLQANLNDDYFKELNDCLAELADRDGILIKSSVGACLQGTDYVYLRKTKKSFWRRWTFAPSYTLPERDERGAQDFTNRTERALNESANALAQAAENMKRFFTTLRDESAFYTGCVNLSDTLKLRGMTTVIPDIVCGDPPSSRVRGMYETGLALANTGAVVTNDYIAPEKRLCVVTGANQGGKSTFLRSIGQMQLMAQCGMFVAAAEASLPVYSGIFTHFTKEEDSGLDSGKLDEELLRMDKIVQHLRKGAIVLFNESFAATNEREGSEIARQIVRALVENGISVVFVTHQYDFARSLFSNQSGTMIFLRAQRLPDGSRTFKITEGEPEHTSYGMDIYNKIFTQKDPVFLSQEEKHGQTEY